MTGSIIKKNYFIFFVLFPGIPLFFIPNVWDAAIWDYGFSIDNISGIETNAVALKILNVNGQEVTNSKRTIGSNSIDISDLSSGIYFLKAEKFNSEIITKRFVEHVR